MKKRPSLAWCAIVLLMATGFPGLKQVKGRPRPETTRSPTYEDMHKELKDTKTQ
jgi:hypothetical protein